MTRSERGHWPTRRRIAPIGASLTGCLLLGLGFASAPASLSAASGGSPLHDYRTVLPQLPPVQRQRLQARAEQWARWDAEQRRQFQLRADAWDAHPLAERAVRRERYEAWRALPANEQARLRAARGMHDVLPPARQQALRQQFDALDASERRGWLLGPSLGVDYAALQPLLAQVPGDEHAPLLQVLREMTPEQRRELAVLVQRTPPQGRAGLRRELLSTSAGQRQEWLWSRLDR